METNAYERLMTYDERRLFSHIGRWGSEGYPIRKLGRKWDWHFTERVTSPTLYTTKREAVAAFERFLAVLYSCHHHEVATTGDFKHWYECRDQEKTS